MNSPCLGDSCATAVLYALHKAFDERTMHCVRTKKLHFRMEPNRPKHDSDSMFALEPARVQPELGAAQCGFVELSVGGRCEGGVRKARVGGVWWVWCGVRGGRRESRMCVGGERWEAVWAVEEVWEVGSGVEAWVGRRRW